MTLVHARVLLSIEKNVVLFIVLVVGSKGQKNKRMERGRGEKELFGLQASVSFFSPPPPLYLPFHCSRSKFVFNNSSGNACYAR